MKKKIFLSVLIFVLLALSVALSVYAQTQMRQLTVNLAHEGNVSVYVDGKYVSDAPLSRYVSKNSTVKLVSKDDNFMFYANPEGNTFGYEGEYSFQMMAKTTIDAWFENTDASKVAVIYKNTNSSQQILAASTFKLSDIDATFTRHLAENASKFGYEFVSWNKTVPEIINAAKTGSRTIIVEPNYAMEENLYSVEVKGGYISSDNPNNGIFQVNTNIAITAGAPETGKKFAYWTNKAGVVISNLSSLTLTVFSDEVYTAHFVDENQNVELVPTVSLIATHDKDADRVRTYAQRFVPENYTIEGYGLIFAKDVVYLEEDMTLENVDGTELRMSFKGDSPAPSGIWTNTISCEDFVCVRAYITYFDSNNEKHVAYSRSCVASKNGDNFSLILDLDFEDGKIFGNGYEPYGKNSIIDGKLALIPGYVVIPVTPEDYTYINLYTNVTFTLLPNIMTDIVSIDKNIRIESSGDGMSDSWDAPSAAPTYSYNGGIVSVGADGYLYLYEASSKEFKRTDFAIERNVSYELLVKYSFSSGKVELFVNGAPVASEESMIAPVNGFDLVLMDYGKSFSVLVDYIKLEKGMGVGCAEHSYSGTVTPPTCKDEGYTTYVCAICGDRYVSDYIPANDDHKYDGGAFSQDYLSVVYTCGVCGDTYSEACPPYTVVYDPDITSTADAQALASSLALKTGGTFEVAEISEYSGNKYINISNVSPYAEKYGWTVNETAIDIYCGAFVSMDTALDKFISSVSSMKDIVLLEDAEYSVSSAIVKGAVSAYTPVATTRTTLDTMSSEMIATVLSSENIDVSNISGTVYYVSENGNDANSGKSEAQAWKTLANVTSANLSSGDAVLFERGGVFRGKVTTVSGVTYGSYGDQTLNKPIIVGSKQNYAGMWTEVEDNIWRLDGADVLDPGNVIFGAHLYDVVCYDEITGKRVFDPLYAQGADSQGSSVTVVNGVLQFLNHGNNTWNKKISLDSSTGIITISFNMLPNLQKAYDILSINGVVVLQSQKNAIKIGSSTHAAAIGYNQTNVVRNVTVTVDPATGEATVTYRHPTNTSHADNFSATVNVGAFEGELLITLGDTTAGNGWTADDFVVTQESVLYENDFAEIMHGYELLQKDYDFYFGTPDLTYSEFNPNSTSYDLYVYYSGDLNNDFDDIEIGEDGQLFNVHSKDNVTVDGICFKYMGGHGIRGGHYQTDNLIARNCVLSWIGGSVLSYNSTTAEVTRYGNAIEIFGSTDGFEVYNNWIYEIYDTGITFQYQGSTNKNDITLKDIDIHDNIIEKCYWGLEWWSDSYTGITHAANIQIHNNFIKSIGDAWGVLQHEDPRWGGALYFSSIGNTVADKTVRVYENIVDCTYIPGYTGTETNHDNGFTKGYRTRIFSASESNLYQTEFVDNTFVQYNDQYIGRLTFPKDSENYDIYKTKDYDWNFFFDVSNDECYEFFSYFPYMQGTKICVLDRPEDLNRQ